jgi:hypothetical protein
MPLFSKWRTPDARIFSRPRITGVLDYYSPFLDDEVGEKVGCWRLPGERDRDYQHRLGIHITEKLNELEALLKRLLDHHHHRGA